MVDCGGRKRLGERGGMVGLASLGKGHCGGGDGTLSSVGVLGCATSFLLVAYGGMS